MDLNGAQTRSQTNSLRYHVLSMDLNVQQTRSQTNSLRYQVLSIDLTVQHTRSQTNSLRYQVAIQRSRLVKRAAKRSNTLPTPQSASDKFQRGGRYQKRTSSSPGVSILTPRNTPSTLMTGASCPLTVARQPS